MPGRRVTGSSASDLADASTATRRFVDRPLVGASLVGIAILHTAAAPAVYPESLESIWDGGVINAVERDPLLVDLRGIGFWYVTAGVVVGLLGAVVHRLEARPEGLSPWFGWGLLCLTAWGVVLMPQSGFWAVAIPGVLAVRQSRKVRPAPGRIAAFDAVLEDRGIEPMR